MHTLTKKTHKLVVIVIDSLIGGGAESVMLTLARNMVKTLNVKVHLILFDNLIDFQIDFPVHIQAIKTKKLEIIPRMFSTIKYRLYAKKIESCFQEIEKNENQKIDLILSNLLQSDRTLTLSKRKNLYFIIHNHQSFKLKLFDKPKLEKARRIKKMQKRYYNKQLICVSKGVEQDLLNNLNLQPKSIQVIYNPFEIEKIQSLANTSLSDLPVDPYIIAVSSFKKQKNIPRLLKAFSLANIQTHKLVIIGKGSPIEYKAIQQLIEKLNLIDKVLLLGFKKNPYPYIKHADLLVLSSDYEGLGGVIVESLICETPVVSTDCPSGPSEILSGHLGQYLAELSERSLADKMLFALNNRLIIDDSHYKRFSASQITKAYLAL